MLQFTKSVEYSLIALAALSEKPGLSMSARDLAEQHGMPLSLTSKSLKILAKAGVLSAHRGAAGGFSLSRDPREVTLGEVVTALEGVPSLTPCCSQGDLAECGKTQTCAIRRPVERLNRWVMGSILDMTLATFLAPDSEGPPLIQIRPRWMVPSRGDHPWP